MPNNKETPKKPIVDLLSPPEKHTVINVSELEEIKKNNPNIPIVTVNASKKGYEAIREKYRLKFTPTYVLVDSNGEKIHKRVGSFSIKKFNSLIS